VTETWVLVFYVFWGASTAGASPGTIEGLADRRACIDTGLQLEEAQGRAGFAGVKWICLYKGGKPPTLRTE